MNAIMIIAHPGSKGVVFHHLSTSIYIQQRAGCYVIHSVVQEMHQEEEAPVKLLITNRRWNKKVASGGFGSGQPYL